MQVEVHDTAQAVASAAAERIAHHLEGLGPASLALAGGSTPHATYERLVNAPIAWGDVVLWLGDERWVPPDHADSNERMARDTLVDRVGARLLPAYRGIDPDIDAALYARDLDSIWLERNGTRGPDLVLLGIGDDGHTASLFPGSAALDATRSAYVANWVPDKDTWRLTASFGLLWSAREILFLVTGAGKAATMARIIDAAEPLPAQRVAAGAGNVTWLVDAAAAAELRPT